MNPLDLPRLEGEPPEPFVDPLAAERALADDLADALDDVIVAFLDSRPADIPKAERALARYRETRNR